MGERSGRIWSAGLRLGLVALVAAGAPGRVSLGQFGAWGAFRDPAPQRCFAIALPIGREGQAALSISSWPKLRAHDQLHVRLSRPAKGAAIEVGGQRFALRTQGIDAWAMAPRDDSRIAASMRGGGLLQIRATDERGRRFRDRYALDGAASAIDAMRLACLPD